MPGIKIQEKWEKKHGEYISKSSTSNVKKSTWQISGTEKCHVDKVDI